MPAVAYPVNPYPAVTLTPFRDGPWRPRTGQAEGAEQPAGSGLGDPRAVSGPAAAGSPDLRMGTLGWGLRTARFTPPSAPDGRHGIRPLADARQLHYDPPGSIPGPGGDLLIESAVPRTVGPAARRTPAVTLTTVERGLKPWASSVRQPARGLTRPRGYPQGS